MLEMKGLNASVPISCKITVHQAQPKTSSGIGRNSACGRHPWSRKLLLNLEVLNAKERLVGSPAFGPNVMVHILGDSNDHACGSSVPLVDSSKSSLCINR